MKKIIFSVLAIGCSATADPYPFEDIEVADVTLAPDSIMEDATREAAQRWMDAACLNIAVQPYGTKVHVATPVGEPMYCEDAEGKLSRCLGSYSYSTDEIRIAGDISTNYVAVVGILVHEIGHKFGVWSHLPRIEGEIMQPNLYPTVDKIGPESLNLICSAVNCPCYNPEPIVIEKSRSLEAQCVSSK